MLQRYPVAATWGLDTAIVEFKVKNPTRESLIGIPLGWNLTVVGPTCR